MSGEDWSATGLFGKLPWYGDYVHRGLPYALADRLAEWLGGGLADSQALLGEGFAEHYALAPPWFFAWPADMAAPVALAGVLTPSRDSAGRRFPLLALSASDLVPPLLAGAADIWYRAAEAMLAGVLAGGTAETLDTALAALPPLRQAAALPLPLHHALAGWRMEPGQALWWTAGGPLVPAGLFMQHGLPEGDDFAALLGAASFGTSRHRVN